MAFVARQQQQPQRIRRSMWAADEIMTKK